MLADPQRLFDGFMSLEGGMDSGRAPDTLEPIQYAYGENITCRGGHPKTRPPYKTLSLSFNSDGDEANFRLNPQGMAYYNAPSGPLLVAAVGGRLFTVNPDTGQVTDVTAVATDPDQPCVWFCQAGPYLVVQNGQAKPTILDGGTSRIAGEDEVPVGTAMAFGLGRLWVARPQEVLAGDIQQADPSTVLKFTETTFLNEGGGFSISGGNITALAFLPVQDTATGQGPLYIFNENGAVSLTVDIPREQWKSTQIERVALRDIGACGQHGLVLLNGDIIFRSRDGIRSYRMARAELGLDGQLPFSAEMLPYVSTDEGRYLKFATGVFFDGRLLLSTQPIWRSTYCTWNGLLVWDTYPITSSVNRGRACWEGIWTGRNFVRLTTGTFNGVHRCFALCRAPSNANDIVEILKQGIADDGNVPINCILDTKAYNHTQPWTEKQLLTADVWLRDLAGDTTLSVYFKPDQFPNWVAWYQMSTCAATSTNVLAELAEQYRPRVRLTDAPTTPDYLLNRQLRIGWEFQFRFQWSGHLGIHRFHSHCVPRPESITPGTGGLSS